MAAYKLIRVEDYGSEGIMPIKEDFELCPKTEERMSCVSRSGNSCCGGFHGTVDKKGCRYAKCNRYMGSV